MALTARLTNPSYGYQKNGYVSYSCTLELSEDASGTPEVVATTGLSTVEAFPIEGWADRIKAAIKVQADAYIAQFKLMMMIVNSVYPSALKPQDAVVSITTEIEPTITV
jgi:hypothetical protein